MYQTKVHTTLTPTPLSSPGKVLQRVDARDGHLAPQLGRARRPRRSLADLPGAARIAAGGARLDCVQRLLAVRMWGLGDCMCDFGLRTRMGVGGQGIGACSYSPHACACCSRGVRSVGPQLAHELGAREVRRPVYHSSHPTLLDVSGHRGRWHFLPGICAFLGHPVGGVYCRCSLRFRRRLGAHVRSRTSRYRKLLLLNSHITHHSLAATKTHICLEVPKRSFAPSSIRSHRMIHPARSCHRASRPLSGLGLVVRLPGVTPTPAQPRAFQRGRGW